MKGSERGLKKTKRRFLTVFLLILIALLLLVVIGELTTPGILYPISEEKSNRPQHCIENKCVPGIVFSRLPPYPENFDEVDLGVQYGKYYWNENFSVVAPDDNYYKQPEFYPNFENKENLGYYLQVKEVDSDKVEYPTERVGVSGYGMYPADTVVKGINPGEDLKVVTYLHTSWFIEKYQGMELKPVFPSHGDTQQAMVSVVQDPDVVKDYFDVKIEPTIILLEPSYPIFFPNWAQKVTVKVHLKENTPKGTYLVGVTPFEPPVENSEEWKYKYGIYAYTDAGMAGIGRPHLQIFVKVE